MWLLLVGNVKAVGREFYVVHLNSLYQNVSLGQQLILTQFETFPRNFSNVYVFKISKSLSYHQQILLKGLLSFKFKNWWTLSFWQFFANCQNENIERKRLIPHHLLYREQIFRLMLNITLMMRAQHTSAVLWAFRTWVGGTSPGGIIPQQLANVQTTSTVK